MVFRASSHKSQSRCSPSLGVRPEQVSSSIVTWLPPCWRMEPISPVNCLRNFKPLLRSFSIKVSSKHCYLFSVQVQSGVWKHQFYVPGFSGPTFFEPWKSRNWETVCESPCLLTPVVAAAETHNFVLQGVYSFIFVFACTFLFFTFLLACLSWCICCLFQSSLGKETRK